MQANYQEIVKVSQGITKQIIDYQDSINALTVHICQEAGGTIITGKENREVLLETLDETECYCNQAVREIINCTGNLTRIAKKANWID